jgi:hypothetical protein
MHLHHQPHPPVGELVEWTQERDGGVVDEDVGCADAVDDLTEEPLPIVRIG